MTAGTTNPMADLYRRLRAVGLTKPFIRKMILPDWWEDDVAENPAGYAEGLAFLSGHLGLDLATMLDPSRPVAFRNFGACKFKKSKGTTEDDLALARAMAMRTAQLATLATAEVCLPLPISAAQMRREILGQNEPCVNLDNLVEFCWSVGIPVLHITSFPKAKRPDGLSAKVGGRPAVVLCKRASSAWLLFILAHELGHIALGHVEGDGVLIDESMEGNVKDQEEEAANAFALELLTGDAQCRFNAVGRWPNALRLAEEARELGRRMRIDPGHIVLNYARTMGNDFYPVAQAALALIEPGKDGMRVIRRRLAEHLDWSSLPEDSSEFLMRVSQAGRTSDLPVG